jgi:hypothetical protein
MADQDGGGAKQLTFNEKMAAKADAMKKKAMAKADQLKKKAEAKAKELKDKKAGGGEEKEKEKMGADQGAGAGAGLAAHNPLKSKSKLLHVRGGAARNSESIQRMRGLSSETPEEQSMRDLNRLAKQESAEAALDEENADMERETEDGLSLLKSKNTTINLHTNEHGIHKKYQDEKGRGETGGLHQQAHPYLSFKQAKEQAPKYHPHFKVAIENKDTGETEHVFEPLSLSISTGWHVMKGEGFINAAAVAIFVLFLLILCTMMAAAVKGASRDDDTATALVVLAALLVLGILALLCLVLFATFLDTLTFDHGDPRKSGKKMYEYGVGIVLYFRWLKFLACLFFFMAMLSVPALFFYHSGTVLDIDNLPALQKLTSLTLGSIGESTPLCYQQEHLSTEYVGDAFYDEFYHVNHTQRGFILVECPIGQITELKVLYGNPTGWCGCHERFRPDEVGACASPQIEEETTTLLDRLNFKYLLNGGFYEKHMDPTELQTWRDSGMRDFSLLQAVLDRQNTWTRAKERILKQDCCGTDFPVTFYHQPTSNPSCTSYTMQPIADAACLGHKSCNLTLNEGRAQDVWNTEEWTPGYDKHNDTAAYRAIHPRKIKKTIGEGFTNESKAGCEATGYKRMVVTAKCYDPYITVEDRDGVATAVQKQTMALIVIGCDVLGCALFLLMVWWLTIQEQEECALFDGATTTCEDYSLMLTGLPHNQDGGVDKETGEEVTGPQKLAMDLKRHIEDQINSEKAKEMSLDYRNNEKAAERNCVVDQVHFGLNNFELIYKKKDRVKWERQEMKYQQKLEHLHAMHQEVKEKAGSDERGRSGSVAAAQKMKKHVVKGNKKIVRQLTRVEKRLKDIDLQLLRLINKLERDESKQVDSGALLMRASEQAEEESQPWRKASNKTERQQHGGGDDDIPAKRNRTGSVADALQHGAGAAAGLVTHGMSAGLKGGLAGVSSVGGSVQKMATSKLHATTAFVTFETQEGRLRALDCFKRGRCFGMLSGGLGESFRGVQLQFDQAPNPGNILWENLGVGKVERISRKLLTFVFTVAFLTVSCGVIFQAKAEQAAMVLRYPPVTCPAETPSAFDVESAYADNNYKPVGLIDCYCKTQLLDILQGSSYDFNTCQNHPYTCKLDANDAPILSEKLCEAWVHQKLRLQGLSIGSVLIVLFVNLILDTMMRFLVKIERKNSRTEELVSIARRVFCASFVNTALISLVIQGNLSFFTDSRTPMAGDHADFTVAWFNSAGTAFMLTMMLNIVVPHAKVWAMYPVHSLKIYFDGFKCCGKPWQTHRRSRQVVQHDLQELLVGPEWELAARYGQILNVIFVTMMFSSTMPLLNFLAVANFTGIYIVDKCAFLRLYKTPPMYDESLALAAAKQMNLAVVMHCCFGAWAFSNLELLRPVEGMNSPAETITAHGLQAHIEAAQAYDPTGRSSFLNAVFRDRLFKAVSSVWLYICFLVFFWTYLLLKEFFFYEFMVAMRFLGLSVQDREEEEKHIFNYYCSLTDETLALLANDPKHFNSLQPEEKVLSQVTAEIELRAKKAASREEDEAKERGRKQSVHEEELVQLRSASTGKYLATKAADNLKALGGGVLHVGQKVVRKATGAARIVKIKETERRMVGLESFSIETNPDYYYMVGGADLPKLRTEVVKNLENEAAFIAVGVAARLKNAAKAEAHKVRPQVTAMLRHLGWDETTPSELCQATGLSNTEVFDWLSHKAAPAAVTRKMKEFVAIEQAKINETKTKEKTAQRLAKKESAKAGAEAKAEAKEKAKLEKQAAKEKAEAEKAEAKEIEMAAVATGGTSTNPLTASTDAKESEAEV